MYLEKRKNIYIKWKHFQLVMNKKGDTTTGRVQKVQRIPRGDILINIFFTPLTSSLYKLPGPFHNNAIQPSFLWSPNLGMFRKTTLW